MAPRKRATNASRLNRAARPVQGQMPQQYAPQYAAAPARQKRSLRPVIILLVLIVVLAVIVVGVVRGCMMGSSRPLLTPGEEVTIVIEEGASANSIGELLEEYGLVPRSSEFTEEVKREDAAANLKPGTYVFVGGTSTAELVAQISEGPQQETVTIPEGKTVSATAELVDAATDGRISADDFMKCANNASNYQADYPFLADVYDNSLEGFLFPKTYEIAKDDTADTVVRKMLDQYKAEVADIDYEFAESKNLTTYDVLILASIVEREAAADVRAEVSSVFYNRLSGGMQLQGDATTAYLVNGDPTPEDLENTAETPYNTQYNYGLPPGPICSPSLESIEAAAHPAKTDFLYFFFEPDENGDLQYYFSTDYDQHQAAINGEGTPYKVESASGDDSEKQKQEKSEKAEEPAQSDEAAEAAAAESGADAAEPEPEAEVEAEPEYVEGEEE